VFSLLLIPRLGPTGAGLATLGTEGINTVGQVLCVLHLLRRLD
jgi:O-antigen/teichoic acid export membrane protein